MTFKYSTLSIKQPLKDASIDLLKIFIIYFILDILLRFYEYYITSPYFSNTKEIAELQLNGFYHDNFKFLTLLFIFFPVYAIIKAIFKKVSYYIPSIILFIFILISFITIQYYIVAFIPLNQSFYNYSISDIIKILNSSSDVGWFGYFSLFSIIILFFILQYKLKLKSKIFVFIIWGLWLIAMPNITYSHVKAKFFPKIQNYYLIKNKAIFFIEESINYLNRNKNDDDQSINIKTLSLEYSKIYHKNNYSIPEYPLMRKNNNPDVLGKYFNLNDSMPNFVFLLLEGMGRNVCGPNARFGSFTPFLDSLIDYSLYWENFLSTADRTFGVIPNVLGSLPSGSGGFYYHEDNPIPSNKTLISYLNDINYRSGFYYGGWTHFQNMDDVLNSSGINYILEKFDSTAVKIESDKEGFSWGYNDKSMFEQYFKAINSDSVKYKRRLDILLTLSLHSPFMPPNKKYYNKIVKNISQKLPESIQKEIKPYENVLSTVVYADDALRGFFKKYKEKTEFNNTVFIIVADHNIHAFPDDNELRKYHIPLIIYSPMLKSGKKFSSVNSHREIAPSIMALIKNKYNVNFDDQIHMIGNSLDDSKNFGCNKTISLFKGSKDNILLLDGNYFTIDNKYYRLKENMNLEVLDDDTIKKELDRKLKIIRKINQYVYYKNKIIPPKFLLK